MNVLSCLVLLCSYKNLNPEKRAVYEQFSAQILLYQVIILAALAEK